MSIKHTDLAVATTHRHRQSTSESRDDLRSRRYSYLKRRPEADEAQAPAEGMGERPEEVNAPTAVLTRIIKEELLEGVSKEAQSSISHAPSIITLL